MEIQFHAIDFAVVEVDQQKYYDDKTKNLFKSQKKLRQLFDGVSDLILRRGIGFVLPLVGNKPLPEYQDYLLILDYPRSYYKEIILALKSLLEDMKDDWHFNDAVDPSSTMPFYRNICHLVVSLAYQANIKGIILS